MKTALLIAALLPSLAFASHINGDAPIGSNIVKASTASGATQSACKDLKVPMLYGLPCGLARTYDIPTGMLNKVQSANFYFFDSGHLVVVAGVVNAPTVVDFMVYLDYLSKQHPVVQFIEGDFGAGGYMERSVSFVIGETLHVANYDQKQGVIITFAMYIPWVQHQMEQEKK